MQNLILPTFNEDKAKETVGAASRRLLLNKDHKQGIVDTQREADKKYFSECLKCTERLPHSEWKDPWYLVVLHKKERLMENVVRRYFFGRQSLPKPEYDQTLWRFYPGSGNLQFIWSIPDKNTTLWIKNNPQEIPEEQNHLKQLVFDFLDDKLYDFYREKFKEDL